MVNWWDRKDVVQSLQFFYKILDSTTFTLVGRRFGNLVVIDDNIAITLKKFKPIKFIGIGLCGWSEPKSVLNEQSKYTRIDVDLDNFPYAHNDLLKLKEWSERKNLKFIAYFTGSRGYRVCFGKTEEPIHKVRFELARLREMLSLWSLDIIPYWFGVVGWSQPPGGLHRKSDLPLFILEEIPKEYYDVFSNALEIRAGKKQLFVPNCSLDGNKFIEKIREMYEELENEQKKKIDARVRRFIAMKTIIPAYRQIYHMYGISVYS